MQIRKPPYNTNPGHYIPTTIAHPLSLKTQHHYSKLQDTYIKHLLPSHGCTVCVSHCISMHRWQHQKLGKPSPLLLSSNPITRTVPKASWLNVSFTSPSVMMLLLTIMMMTVPGYTDTHVHMDSHIRVEGSPCTNYTTTSLPRPGLLLLQHLACHTLTICLRLIFSLVPTFNTQVISCLPLKPIFRPSWQLWPS